MKVFKAIVHWSIIALLVFVGAGLLSKAVFGQPAPAVAESKPIQKHLKTIHVDRIVINTVHKWEDDGTDYYYRPKRKITVQKWVSAYSRSWGLPFLPEVHHGWWNPSSIKGIYQSTDGWLMETNSGWLITTHSLQLIDTDYDYELRKRTRGEVIYASIDGG